MGKKQDKKGELEQEFNRIKENSNIDVSKYLAKTEDLPDLGEIQIYDYEKDIIDCQLQADKLLKSLVDLYLGDAKGIIEHEYIMNKMREDMLVYSETIFLQKMTRKNFLQQLRQIDNGDNGARMHEVVNQTIGQIRDNIKFYQSQRTELEKFYKEIRKDYNELLSDNIISESEQDDICNKDNMLDNRLLNDIIDKIAKNKGDNK